MAEQNGTPVEIYSEDIETLSYTFAQVQKAFADVIHPDMVHTESDSPNSLKMIVKNNFQTINNLVNKLGTGDIVFDEDFKDIQTAILKLWDWYKKDAGESGDVTSTEKITELMNIVGIAFDENGYPIETDDENSLINKIESIIRARPERGILAKHFPRKNKYFDKNTYKEIMVEKDSTEFNKFISFKNIKVEAGKTYTISLPKDNVYSLWYLKTIVDKDSGSSEIKPPNNTDKSISLSSAEFTIPEDIEYISISFELNSIEDFYIENIVIEERYDYYENNLLENVVEPLDPWGSSSELIAEKLITFKEKTYIFQSKLNKDRPIEQWQLSVPYSLKAADQGNFTILNIPVLPSTNYVFNFPQQSPEGESPSKPDVIHYLKLEKNSEGSFDNYESIGIEFCSDYQQSFWTRPNTTHVSISFIGDSNNTELYQEPEAIDNTMFRERTEQDYSVGATLSLNKNAKGYSGNQLHPGEKFQAIKGLEETGIKWDYANTLRIADLNSNYNFYINPFSDNTSIYEIKIIKSGYYMVAGQLGFERLGTAPDVKNDMSLELKAAIMLKNTEELPYRTMYYDWGLSHTNETLISLSNIVIPPEGFNEKIYKATVSIPPKIVQLKAGDSIYLKGSFSGGWDTTNKCLRMDHEKHSTYLTVLKLKDISPYQQCRLTLKPYFIGTEWKEQEDQVYGAGYEISNAETGEILASSQGGHNNTEVSVFVLSGTKIHYSFTYTGKHNGKDVSYVSEQKDFLVTENEDLFVPMGWKVTHKHEYGDIDSADEEKYNANKELFYNRLANIKKNKEYYEVVRDGKEIQVWADDGVLVPGFNAYKVKITGKDDNITITDPIHNADTIITHYYKKI